MRAIRQFICALLLLAGAAQGHAQISASSLTRFKEWRAPLHTSSDTRVYWMQINSVSGDGVWAVLPDDFASIYVSNTVTTAFASVLSNLYVNTAWVTNGIVYQASESSYYLGPMGSSSSLWLTNVSFGVMIEFNATVIDFLKPVALHSINSLTNELRWEVNTRLIATNNAVSNITVNFSTTNTVEIWATNNLTFTNWSNVFDNGRHDVIYLLRPQLIPRGVNWGNLGLSNPGYGVAIATNANNTLWTTLTNGKVYALSITRIRTNLFPTLTLWE